MTTPGNYSVSAAASAGNFVIFVEGYDEIDVSGPIEQTLQFTDARPYLIEVQDDIFGTSEAITWSVTIDPAGVAIRCLRLPYNSLGHADRLGHK